MTDHSAALLDIVDRYLAMSINFDEFQRSFSEYYLDGVPDSGLTRAEFERYAEVHERVEWTAASPTTEEKELGWMDTAEFFAWLSTQRRAWFDPG